MPSKIGALLKKFHSRTLEYTGRASPISLLLFCSLRISPPNFNACLPRILLNVSRKAYVFWLRTPGVLFPRGTPKSSRGPVLKIPSICDSGIPKLTRGLVLTSSKLYRLKFTRAWFRTVGEIVQFHNRVPAGSKGLFRMFDIGRNCRLGTVRFSTVVM